METLAVVLEAPELLALRSLPLTEPGVADVVVEVSFSGISTGTERLLWSGRMPPFPGLGYPLVPGYESVGTVVHAGPEAGFSCGDRVFVPGARCFGEVRGLFGGAASHLMTAADRVTRIDAELGERGVLLALAATAWHAVRGPGARLPELIVGHGVLGRLLARITVALGGAAPLVWETHADRRAGALGYPVCHPDEDERKDYASIQDVSGDPEILDRLIARLARGGEVVLAGFYPGALSFSFPPAFMREAHLRVAAEWSAGDLDQVLALVEAGRLSLDGLITHREPAADASEAYRTAFGDPRCLKMVLDWRKRS
jgi:3-hydroxyethyl bacteriochlorophyllide a dehydrogenase